MNAYIPDLLFDISSYLSVEDLYHISSSRKRYRKLIFEARNLVDPCTSKLDRFKHLVRLEMKEDEKMKYKVVRNIPKLVTLNELILIEDTVIQTFNIDLSTLTNLKSLTLNTPCVSDISKLTQLKS